MKTSAAASSRLGSEKAAFESMGQATLPLATPYGKDSTSVTLDVVPADITALLSMNVFDRERLVADAVASRLTKTVKDRGKTESPFYCDEWHVPLYRSRKNHVYAERGRPAEVLLTRSRLHKVQRQSFHPSPEKLFNLLPRPRTEETSPDVLEILQHLTRRCDPCQRIQYTSTQFCLSSGAENVLFNEQILHDIVTIDETPLLQRRDKSIGVSTARAILDLSTKKSWQQYWSVGL